MEGGGYSIASLHQFHCLYLIMREFGRCRLGEESANPDMQRHVTHCFDYLRQSQKCCGDAALEGESDTVKGMTDGWGTTHVCKSDRELVDWVYKNRYSEHTGIA